MGNRGGKREGAGRPGGSRNRRTVELALRRQRDSTGNKPLAKEVLERFMLFYTEAAMQYLPPLPIAEEWPDAQKFHSYADKAGHFARMLAPYQSPTYKSITVQAPRESSAHGTPAIDALEAFVLTLAAVRRREPQPAEKPAAEPTDDVPMLIDVKPNGGQS